MLTDGRFWAGVIAGVAVVFVYHAFIAPLPSTKTSG